MPDDRDPPAERVLVIVPTYDERENLPTIVAAILRETEADVLVVDDDSPDGTGALADALAVSEPRLSVLHRAGKQGLGRAYLDAFAHALALPQGYTHLVQMDADLSHDPAAIPSLLQACRAGADVALGSRWVPGGGTVHWPLRRQLLSRGGSRYAAAVLGLRIRDLTGGFKCWRRAVLEALPRERVAARGYAFQIEMTARAIRQGFRVVEVPITFTERTAGRSKMSGRIVREALGAVWRLRRELSH
jgi:dolichol-phosphate mannosyltransferase